MKTKLKLAAALFLLFSAASSSVEAEILDGQTVVTEMLLIEPHNSYNFMFSENVVGPGQELTDFGLTQTFWDGPHKIDVDFSDMNILITIRSNVIIQGLSLTFRDKYNGTIPPFTNVTVTPATTWPDFGIARVRSDHEAIFMNFSGGSGLQGKQISLDINSIPEPFAAGLMLFGVAFLIACRRFPISPATVRSNDTGGA